MDDWLIFQYHLIRAQAESEVLREPLRGLPTSVLGQRRGDAGGGSSTQALVCPGVSA